MHRLKVATVPCTLGFTDTDVDRGRRHIRVKDTLLDACLERPDDALI